MRLFKVLYRYHCSNLIELLSIQDMRLRPLSCEYSIDLYSTVFILPGVNLEPKVIANTMVHYIVKTSPGAAVLNSRSMSSVAHIQSFIIDSFVGFAASHSCPPLSVQDRPSASFVFTFTHPCSLYAQNTSPDISYSFQSSPHHI